MRRAVLLVALVAAACSGGSDPLADAAALPDSGADAAGGADAPEAALDAPPAVDAAPMVDADPRPALSTTGLYSDFASRTLADGVVEYEPAYALWSDGAEKRRYLLLPPGTEIDTSDMDGWIFPVGTKIWKEFALDGQRLETRLIERTGEGPMDYFMGAYIWQLDESEAFFEMAGKKNVHGTMHDVPSSIRCFTCHIGQPGRVLGLTAVQLSHDRPGLNLESLIADDLLSDPPVSGTSYAPPGDPTTADALGYLNANCGHCHNPTGSAWADVDQVLLLHTSEVTPEATEIYTTTLGVPLQYWHDEPFEFRIVPGDPTLSAISFRLGFRGSTDQMPPIFATEIVDAEGLAAVDAWITSLPH